MSDLVKKKESYSGFPDALADLLSRNTGDQLPDLDDFHNSIDESDYSAGDWIEALIGFDEWLNQKAIPSRPFELMLGYIRCCTAKSSINISLASLKVTVLKSLTDFGFEGDSSSQI